jgi:hypothetical protein
MVMVEVRGGAAEPLTTMLFLVESVGNTDVCLIGRGAFFH